MRGDEVEQHFLKQYPGAKVEVFDLTGTNNHYQMTISCTELQKMPRIAAHRLVMSLFEEQIKSGEIHALTIHFKS